MRRGPGGLAGNLREVLQVTYATGDVEQFLSVEEAKLSDRNSVTLDLFALKPGGGQQVVATLVLANVRKLEWVAAP